MLSPTSGAAGLSAPLRFHVSLASESLPHLRPHQSARPPNAQRDRSTSRGRQTAKRSKVARDVKHYSPPTDITALERDLQGKKHGSDGDDWAEDSHEWADEDAPSARRR